MTDEAESQETLFFFRRNFFQVLFNFCLGKS